MTTSSQRLYDDLAWLWPALSPPDTYADEARGVHRLIQQHGKKTSTKPARLLELGSGGGHMLFHLQKWYDVTGSDLSEPMIRQSINLNPLVTHVQADMRTMRLGETFDVVFIHDALGYMQTRDDLSAALQTAAAHLSQGGLIILMPDETLETFENHQQADDHFQVDDDTHVTLVSHARTLTDTPCDGGLYELTMLFLIRRDGKLDLACDRHHCGLFSQETWRALLEAQGFANIHIDDDCPWRAAPVITAARSDRL